MPKKSKSAFDINKLQQTLRLDATVAPLDLHDALDVLEDQEPERKKVFTVSEITNYLKNILSMDPVTGTRLCVRGELSNVSASARGHVYFTLKDADAALRGVIWAGTARELPFDPEDGQEVFLTGRLEIYAPNGSYSIITESIEPVGVGALQLAFAQIQARLEAEGLFLPAFKKPLPAFPQRIGIVTAPTGAVIHDMLRVLRRKNPLVHIVIAPVPVQGKDAAHAIADAIDRLHHELLELDLIILARGGGSFEDLFCFSEEAVVRAIFKASIPVISGVGHEPDWSLADAVADHRASTPTAAAEIAVPDIIALYEALSAYQSMLLESIQAVFYRCETQFDHAATAFIDTYRYQILAQNQTKLDKLQSQLLTESERILTHYSQTLSQSAAELHALSPLATLGRGYSILTDANGSVIASVHQLEPGLLINAQLTDGRCSFEVKETYPNA